MSPRVERSDPCRSWTVVEHVESRWFAAAAGGGGANELTLPTRRKVERINIDGEAEIIPLLWFILVLTDATSMALPWHGRDRKNDVILQQTTPKNSKDHSQKLREAAKLGKDIAGAVCVTAHQAPAPPQSYQFSRATEIILLEACRRQKSPGGYYCLISGQR